MKSLTKNHLKSNFTKHVLNNNRCINCILEKDFMTSNNQNNAFTNNLV